MKALKIAMLVTLFQSPFLLAHQYLETSEESSIEREQLELTMSPGERMLRTALGYHPLVIVWDQI